MLKIKQSGFSLIELMITVAIVGILASVAYPAYTNQIVKTRRVDTQRELTNFAQSMERYFTSNGRYVTVVGGATCGVSAPAATTFYTFASSNCSDNTFTITATPVNTSSQKDDGTLTLNQQGVRGGSVNNGNWVK